MDTSRGLKDLKLRVISRVIDVDAAMIILSDEKLAYESEVENIVIGFSEDHEPIWLEILDVAKDFLPKLEEIIK